MRIIFALVFFAAAAFAAPINDDLDFPVACEDVLAGPICAQLRGIAEQAGMKVDEIEAQIKKAIGDGKQKAEEIREAVMEFLKTQLSNKKCEDFLGADRCGQIKKLVQMFGGAVEKVDEAVREAVIQGALKIKDLYKKVMDYLRSTVLGKRSIVMSMSDDDLDFPIACEDVLAGPVCAQLRGIAEQVGMKVDEIEAQIKKAIGEGKQKAEEIREAVMAFLKAQLSNKRCEDFLGAERCGQVKKLVQMFGGAVEKVDEAVREAVIQGALTIKDLYKKVMDYLRSTVLGKRSIVMSMSDDDLDFPIACEDVLAGPVCAQLRGIAERVGMKIDEIEAQIKKAIGEGKQKAEEIREAVMTFLKTQVSNKKCEDFLGADRCGQIKKLVQMFGGAVEKVDEAVREAVIKGAQKIKDIYKQVMDYLRSTVLGKRSIVMSMSDDDLDFPVACEDVLAGPICAQLRGIAERVGMKVDEIEAQIKKAIGEGKQKAEEIREAVMAFLKTQVANKKCEDFLGADRCGQIKKLVQMFGGAVEKVDEAVREAVMKGAQKIKDIYKQVMDYLRNVLVGKRSIEMTITDHDLEFLDELELDDEDTFEKRNIIIDILRKKIEFFSKLFGKVLNSNLDKVLQEVLTTRKAEIEAIIGQGPYAILKLALELYQKAKAMG